MTHVSITEAREDLANLVNRVAYGGEQVVLRRRGRDMAVLISPRDAEVLERALRAEEDRSDRHSIEEAKEEAGEVEWEMAKRRLGL